jgi:hypothetical protein
MDSTGSEAITYNEPVVKIVYSLGIRWGHRGRGRRPDRGRERCAQTWLGLAHAPPLLLHAVGVGRACDFAQQRRRRGATCDTAPRAAARR